MGFFDDIISGIVGAATSPLQTVEDFFSSFDPTGLTDEIAQAIVAAANYGYQAITAFGTLVSGAVIDFGKDLLETIIELGTTAMEVANIAYGLVTNSILSIFSYLTEFVNNIYGGFRNSINDAMVEAEAHVTQFAAGVTDKAAKLAAWNVAVAVVKHDSENGTIGLHTFKKAAIGGAGAYVGMEILKGFLGV